MNFKDLYNFERCLYNSHIQLITFSFLEIKEDIEASTKHLYTMPKDKSVPSKKEAGKGSLSEAKTNEDFNKEKPQKDDQQLKIKSVKK